LAQRATGEPGQEIPGSLASNGERWRRSRSAKKPSLSDAIPEFGLSLDNLP
ncbi:hypothetical protein A2U01_0042648, partial [Trifolium medium]|nr:hypothetical protein [Trifolium medium]